MTTLDEQHVWEIAVCETGGWTKKPISFATGGPYTHSYMPLGALTVRGKQYAPGNWSMEPGGLIWRPFGYWGEESAYTRFDLSNHQKHLVKSFMVQHERAKYDYVGDVIVGIDDLTPNFLNGAFHFIEHYEDALSPRWFCSAFTDAAFTFAGVTVIEGFKYPHGVTPMDLYRMMVSHGWGE